MKKQLLRTLTASILLMSTSVLAQEQGRRERNVSRQPNLAAVSTSPVS